MMLINLSLFVAYLCRWVHRSRGAALAHEAFLLLWVWGSSRWSAVHHAWGSSSLLQLLWVTLCRILRLLWRAHR